MTPQPKKTGEILFCRDQ